MAFESQWADWQPKGPTQRTDKTDKSPSVSFVSESPRRILPLEEGKTLSEGLRARTDKTDKRCSADLIASPDGVPAEWVQGVADLLAMPPHPHWTEPGWETVQQDALAFLRGWAAQAHRLGWNARDLFSVHASAPHARLDGMGLVPLLGGRAVALITDDSAGISAESGGTLTYRRRKAWPPGCCLIWEAQIE